jgi:uncharacterized protein YndB with AHSA1/START domain
MVAPVLEETIQLLNIVKEIEIAAPIEIAFEAVLTEMGPESQIPDGSPMPMKLEPWPGGRWYRDMGDNSGHLWGHVQVIKPPKLIEVCGPMFMSFAVASHIQYRLTDEGNNTRVKLTHTAFGMIPEGQRTGVNQGWQYKLERIREMAESKR